MADVISGDDASYAFELVRAICAKVGPGLPGSAQEQERAAMIRGELESHLGAENVLVEEFTLAPGAFLGSLPLCAIFTLLAALLNIAMGRLTGISPVLTAVAALAFSILAVLLVFLEFALYFEFIDPFFRKKRSVNVIGRLRKPGTQDVKRLLILSGHHDSALENTWLRYLGSGFLIAGPTVFIGCLTMLVMSAIQLAGVLTGSAAVVRAGTLGWVLLVYPIVPSIIFAMFFNMGRKNGGTVPGAADNLSACALALAMCRFLVRNPDCIPADTEVRFITFGSEEAGVRGSRRYVERHLDELRGLDARVLNFETIIHPEIDILTSDLYGSVKNSPEMVQSVVAAAQRAGVPFRVRSASAGVGTDAGRFSQAGLKAASLLGFKVPGQMVTFYHQKRDTPEILTMEPLLNVLKLTIEWVSSGGEGSG